MTEDIIPDDVARSLASLVPRRLERWEMTAFQDDCPCVDVTPFGATSAAFLPGDTVTTTITWRRRA